VGIVLGCALGELLGWDDGFTEGAVVGCELGRVDG
jgi:hypothetical protein